MFRLGKLSHLDYCSHNNQSKMIRSAKICFADEFDSLQSSGKENQDISKRTVCKNSCFCNLKNFIKKDKKLNCRGEK